MLEATTPSTAFVNLGRWSTGSSGKRRPLRDLGRGISSQYNSRRRRASPKGNASIYHRAVPANGLRPGDQMAACRAGKSSRARLALVGAASCLWLVSLTHPAQEGHESEVTPERPSDTGALNEEIAPSAVALTIAGPVLAGDPQDGKGRLEIAFGGNRRWCTFPDDRVIRPQGRSGPGASRRTEVFTFGYKFTVAAVKRGAADASLMLFESPVYRTASWRPAFKLGLDLKTPTRGPKVMSDADLTRKSPPKPGPHTLVPFWQDQYRCVTVGPRMDFDLDPGTYDLYVAFDVMIRDGSWAHRTTGFLTDVPIQAARHTRVDGIVNLASGREREVELLTSDLLPDGGTSEAGDR